MPATPSTPAALRNNVRVSGRGQPMMLVHGFGCDQAMWRFVTPAFEADYQVVLLDLVGAGGSDASAYDLKKYSRLQGYAADILEICEELDLRDVVFVGHSVSAMIGVLAAIEQPERFAKLVLVGPSPCYVNRGDYVGGFTQADIDSLLDFLDSNHLGWSSTMAPVIMGTPDKPELSQELANSFCRTNPDIARHFARVTFHSDNRDDLPKAKTESLVLQCSHDAIAPDAVGEYVSTHLPNAHLVRLAATGHCPHLSAPAETIAAIKDFLDR